MLPRDSDLPVHVSFLFFFLRFFSHIDHFLNLIEFVTILFLFYVLAFRL